MSGSFIRFNVPAAGWALVILFISALPGSQIPVVHFWDLLAFDKFIHFSCYLILLFLLTVGFKKQYTYPWLRFKARHWALLFGVLYAIVTEVLQGVVFVERNFDFYDLIANLAGCLAGLAVFNLVYYKI